MKYIVTGGAGFIGSHVVEGLLDMGHTVTVIDNFVTGRPENLNQHRNKKQLTVIEQDITDTELIRPYFKDVDRVIHFAALADIVPSITNPAEYFKTNVTGTFSVVEASRLENVKKIIYAASSSCYGICKDRPTKETAGISPQYPYAFTKYLGEEILFHWSSIYEIPAISLRLFNVFGPRSRTSGTYGAVFGVFLAQRLHKKPLTIVGDGRQERDFIYISDVVDAFLKASDSDTKKGIFNIGTGKPNNINKLASLIGGSKVYMPKRPGEPDFTHADISKTKKELNWQPKVSFEEGVKKMLDNIDNWSDAPVWTENAIKDATKEWFNCLTKK